MIATSAPEWLEDKHYAASNEDGHDVTVYVQHWPARFYRIVSAGAGIDLATGSSKSGLAYSIAQEIADGMLGTCSEPRP